MEPQKLRASPKQISTLIDFMERHGDLTGRAQSGDPNRWRLKRMWGKLAILLNSVDNGVERTQNRWRKIWADWKTKTRKKVLTNRYLDTTGSCRRHNLTTNESRIAALLGLSTAGGKTLSQQEDSIPQEDQVQFVVELPKAKLTSRSKPSRATTPQSEQPRRRLPQRRLQYHKQTFSERAASAFAALENRRLQLEEARESRLHKQEMERLRLESQRIDATRENNRLLQQLGIIVQKLMETVTENGISFNNISSRN